MPHCGWTLSASYQRVWPNIRSVMWHLPQCGTPSTPNCRSGGDRGGPAKMRWFGLAVAGLGWAVVCSLVSPATGSTCLDKDSPTKQDANNRGCGTYTDSPGICGLADDTDFTAALTCCACGGGHRVANEDRNGALTDLEYTAIDTGVYRKTCLSCSECEGRAHIRIPDNVSIPASAFVNCDSLQSVFIPIGVTEIGAGAFQFCRALKVAWVPVTVSRLRDLTFYGCTQLEAILLPDSMISIGVGAFFGDKALRLAGGLPSALATIGEEAFRDCELIGAISVPDGVTHIPAGTFRGCRAADSVRIPETVTSIGFLAFFDLACCPNDDCGYGAGTTTCGCAECTTVTTALPTCGGKPDPESCVELTAAKCTAPLVSGAVQRDCPAMCGTCPTSTVTTVSATSATSATATSATFTSTVPLPTPCVDSKSCVTYLANADPQFICWVSDDIRASCPVICGDCTPTPSASTVPPPTTTSHPVPAPSCTTDSRCHTGRCNMITGRCSRCGAGAFLLEGLCVDASECRAAGLVPVFSERLPTGGACVAAGSECNLRAEQSCRSPAELGEDCILSRVVSPTAPAECLRCKDRSWLMDGRCTRLAKCNSKRFISGTAETCTCTPSNGQLPPDEVECDKCFLRKEPPRNKKPAWQLTTNSNHFMGQCDACPHGATLAYGRCLLARECPSHLAQPEPWACEAPFSCIRRSKVSDGPNAGQRCDCQATTCKECIWGPGAENHRCTVCKRKSFLLEGQCISSDECASAGRVATEGPAWPRGGICASQ